MPTYGYQCTQCAHEFSVFQSMKDEPVSICPECNGAVKRLMYPVGIVFKGSGWYINDSRKPEKAEKSETSTTSEKTETKSENTSEKKSESTPAAEAKPAETKSVETKTEAAAKS